MNTSFKDFYLTGVCPNKTCNKEFWVNAYVGTYFKRGCVCPHCGLKVDLNSMMNCIIKHRINNKKKGE